MSRHALSSAPRWDLVGSLKRAASLIAPWTARLVTIRPFVLLLRWPRQLLFNVRAELRVERLFGRREAADSATVAAHHELMEVPGHVAFRALDEGECFGAGVGEPRLVGPAVPMPAALLEPLE